MFKEFMEYFVENSFSGARLRIYREIPTSEPKAVVHITHGMAEHEGSLLYTSPSPRDVEESSKAG